MPKIIRIMLLMKMFAEISKKPFERTSDQCQETETKMVWSHLELLAQQRRDVDEEQGPVVQSIVSLTSSLRGQFVKCFIT